MSNLKFIIRLCKSLSNEYAVELHVLRNNPKYGNTRLLIDKWRDRVPFVLLGNAVAKLVELSKTISDIENILDFESFTKYASMTAKDMVLGMIENKYYLPEIHDHKSVEKILKTMINTEVDTKVHDNKVLFYMKSASNISTFKKSMIDDLTLDLKEENPTLGSKFEEHLNKTLKVEAVTDEKIYCIRYEHDSPKLMDEVRLLVFAWLQGCCGDNFSLISVPTYYTNNIITIANKSITSKLGKEKS